jgi:two-component system, sensor histidine kinase YesM
MLALNKVSFRNKLRTAFLSITILSILITSVLSYTITATILQNNALKLTQDTIVKSAQSVDEKLSKLMVVMMTFMISQPFQTMLKDVSVGNQSTYYTHMTNLDNVFSQARIAEPLIHSIYVSTPMGEFYPLTLNRNRQHAFQDSPLYERFQKEKRTVWVEGHEDLLFSGKQRVISLVLEPIADFPLKDVYVVVNIREEGLQRLVRSETDRQSIRFLLNTDAKLVSKEPDPLVTQVADSPMVEQIVLSGASGSTSYELGREDYLLNYARLGVNQWTIIAIQSMDHVLKDMIYVKWMIVAITAASFVLTLLVSGAFTRYLLKPLQELQKIMKRVEGNDLTARYHSRNEDELAQVGNRFNRMLEQIVRLIEEVKVAEASKRSTEIKALSAQMDPHFLYNTLNTIYWKLKLKKVDESQKMVVSLSRLFQLGLNKGQEITTLAKEIQHVSQYLELQAFCYEGLFEYDIVVEDPELLEVAVPRIILQPLVENSILHGFNSMESGGQITVRVAREPERDRWSMVVQDNGCGMEESMLRSMVHLSPEHGYAIGNLISRLQLVYGHEVELQVSSKLREGTTVYLSIPMKGDSTDA